MFRRPLLCAMLQTPARPVLVTFAMLALCATSVGVSARDGQIVVRVYDTGAGHSIVRAAAISTAASIVTEAGMRVEWRDCTDGPARRLCKDASRAGDLTVRILPASAGPSSEDADFQLGIAVIDPDTRAGAMASVFEDRVRTVASRARVDFATLLGRVLAHEVGHLLLR